MERRRYGRSSSLQLESHDLLNTRLTGGHEDELNSSCLSLAYDAGRPRFRIHRTRIWLYHGDQPQYPVRKLSDLVTADRAMQHGGQVVPNETIPLYTACARALERGLFLLTGPYDCANEYTRSLASRDVPRIHADTWLPIYFDRNTTALDGIVAFRRWFDDDDDDAGRFVTAVNVTRIGGDLRRVVDTPEIVYLGGHHVHPIDHNIDSPSKPPTKFMRYTNDTRSAEPGATPWSRIRISSPFPNTFLANSFGLNVALAKVRNGPFLYWATCFQPPPGEQLSPIPLTELPDTPFCDSLGNIAWHGKHDDDSTPFASFEGAWVLRGLRLHDQTVVKNLPPGILDRLRGGFFREQDACMVSQVHRIQSRLAKTIASFDRLGPEMFGFKRTPRGTIACTLEKLSAHLKMPSDVLPSFILHFGVPGKFFQGPGVSWVTSDTMDGPFELQQPFPVGPWMTGRLVDTGAGLLNEAYTDIYYSVTTKKNVSVLSKYTGPGILSGADPVILADFVTAEPESVVSMMHT